MKLLATAFLFVCTIVIAQNTIKELKPVKILPLNLSTEGAARFKSDQELYHTVSAKLDDGARLEDLSNEERSVWNEMDETREDYWDVIGGGCSWYCGGGPNEVKASSELNAQGASSYVARNAHDLSYKTAWVEGVSGYGIGEFLVYRFSPESPRITDIIVVNGYVKSENSYQDNSRVKKLKMYLNDKPVAILHLVDQRSRQVFKFEPIGNSDRQNFNALKLQPAWALKFEILDIYKGIKYDDVAITEIFFDGIDVH